MGFHKALPRPISKRSNNKGGHCCIVERSRTDEAIQYGGAKCVVCHCGVPVLAAVITTVMNTKLLWKIFRWLQYILGLKAGLLSDHSNNFA